VLGKTEVEVRGIDEEYSGRTPAGEQTSHFGKEFHHGPDTWDDLGNAHQGKLIDAGNLFKTCVTQPRATNTVGADRGGEAPDFPQDVRPVLIPRDFPGRNEYFLR
jgi:hypothetical protein